MNAQYAVQIIESERGWGQRVDDTFYFDSYEKALKFAKDFNSKNTEKTVPDWYMRAEQPVLVDLDRKKS